jgi:hypothetical protein
MKSPPRREPDVPADLLRARFENVTELQSVIVQYSAAG